MYKDDILNSGASSTSSQCSRSSPATITGSALNNDQVKNIKNETFGNTGNTEDASNALQRRGSNSAFVNYRSTKAQQESTANTPSPSVEMHKFQKSDSNSSVGSNSTTSNNIRNEWRRKSYGFEKMTPPPETTMSHCMESSTDSGIGRSGGDLHGTTTTNAPKNGTIVHISNPVVDNYSSYRSSFRNSLSGNVVNNNNNNRLDNPKRHSIAVVDDRKYLSENVKESSGKAQASVNGFNVIFNSTTTNGNNSLAVTNATNPPTTAAAVHNQPPQSQQHSKRVEFCKTEVHFAPESGRVNIVETDGKPPPTNNFRRRRSSTSFSSSSSSSATSSIGGATSSAESSSYESAEHGDETKAVMDAIKLSSGGGVESRNEEEVRGILKNKPVKPKPYHLGENCADGESLFGVKLRPVSGDYSNWAPRPMTVPGSISLYKEADSGGNFK